MSLGLITLGFVVDRFDLLLVRMHDLAPSTAPAALEWVPVRLKRELSDCLLVK